jgi:rod shape-determining protein MreD
MVAGAVAGGFHRVSSRSLLRPLAALVVALAVVTAGRAASAVVAEGSFALDEALTAMASTVAVGLGLLPPMVAVDRALVRRRLG